MTESEAKEALLAVGIPSGVLNVWGGVPHRSMGQLSANPLGIAYSPPDYDIADELRSEIPALRELVPIFGQNGEAVVGFCALPAKFEISRVTRHTPPLSRLAARASAYCPAVHVKLKLHFRVTAADKPTAMATEAVRKRQPDVRAGDLIHWDRYLDGTAARTRARKSRMSWQTPPLLTRPVSC